MRVPNQKNKMFAVYWLLSEQTDDKHPMPIQQLMEKLAEQGIRAERKSLYRDFAALKDCGVDVRNRRGRTGGWYLASRKFQLSELKMLVDAVLDARSLSRRKSLELVEKLGTLTSRYAARSLRWQGGIERRVKTTNEETDQTVSKIHMAMQNGGMVTFRYFGYTMRKEKIYHNGGKRYRVIPKGFLWEQERYYLVAWESQRRELRHFRVDQIECAMVTNRMLPSHAETGSLDLVPYAQKHFGLFGGRETNVTLRCAAHLAGVMLDRFGMETECIPEGNETFTITVPVVVSTQFWGWLFGLGEAVQVLAPEWALEEYRCRLRAVFKQQQ